MGRSVSNHDRPPDLAYSGVSPLRRTACQLRTLAAHGHSESGQELQRRNSRERSAEGRDWRELSNFCGPLLTPCGHQRHGQLYQHAKHDSVSRDSWAAECAGVRKLPRFPRPLPTACQDARGVEETQLGGDGRAHKQTRVTGVRIS